MLNGGWLRRAHCGVRRCAMVKGKKLLIFFCIYFTVCSPTLAAPRKRGAQATPPQVIPPVLRVEDLSVVHRSSARSMNAMISVRVVNRSSGEARDVSAYVVFRNGYAVQLKGQRRIPGFGQVVFNGNAALPPALMTGPRVTLSCTGCRRVG